MKINTNPFKDFDIIVEKLSNKKKAKIAVGLNEYDKEIIESLYRSEQYASFVLVGTDKIKDIKDFSVVIDENPEQKIIDMLINEEVDGVLRGTIDDFKTLEAYIASTGKTYSEDSPVIMQDAAGHRFFLSPMSNTQGWEKEERLKIAHGLAIFAKEWGINVKIAILTGVRHGTYERKKDTKDGVVGTLNKTYEDAEWIVNKLKDSNLEVKNYSVDLDIAVKDGYTIIVPVNGMVGNQIFRAILLSGGKLLTATYFGLDHYIEDNSRNEKDLDFHIKWLVALINKKNS